MAQHIVMRGLLYKTKKDLNFINKFYEEKGWGKVDYVMKFKTLPGQGSAGGRSDVVFKFVDTSGLGKFSVQRFSLLNPPSWLGDYVNNNRNIIPPAILERLRKIVKQTGDYAERQETEGDEY